ncbi:beta propeller repeat protein [Methanolinea mesophila]|uniref:PKD domain-containing protein n=1 Tax=Methanolinea mesophila TaxID=547055 RepID=UPI001AE50279|nr:beta propeller repeat protein [Methanolinea mesophila]
MGGDNGTASTFMPLENENLTSSGDHNITPFTEVLSPVQGEDADPQNSGDNLTLEISNTTITGANDDPDGQISNETALDNQTGTAQSLIEPGMNTPVTDTNTNPLQVGTSATLTPLDTFTQKCPSIYKDRVVWEDWQGGLPQIHIYNITTGLEQDLCPDTNSQTHPDIWEDWVVWQNKGEMGYTIRLFDLKTGNMSDIAQISGDWIIPHIANGKITWYDSSDVGVKVFCYTIENNSTEILTDTGINPDIWGNFIVWEDYRDQDTWYSHIYLYDLQTGTERKVTDNPSLQQKPRISGTTVVYVDNGEIHAVNLVTGTDIWLNEGSSGDNPVIYGDMVAFESSIGYGGISVVSLGDGTGLFLDSNEYGAPIFGPDLGEGRMVFVNAGNAGDIGLYTFGVPDYPFRAVFTENGTTGEVPFTVTFTDDSVGSPSGWQWDFGDGNRSDEQNPVHTYTSPGIYSVILRIFDPTHRDACSKPGLIACGNLPEADFGMNISCGPVPQVVSFYDLSGGSPTEWWWDFGDGGQSGEQNPLHEYTAPGIYNVSLIVTNALGNSSMVKTEAVTVLPVCRNELNFDIPGVFVSDDGVFETIAINSSMVSVNYPLPGDKSLIEIHPDSRSGISAILLFASPGLEFSDDSNGTVSGTFSGIRICTSEMTGSAACVGDATCRYNLSFTTDHYPASPFNATQWEGVTPADEQIESRIAIQHYCDLYRGAYTVRFEKDNLNLTGPANLTFGVSRDWLEENGWGDHGNFSVDTDPEGVYVYVDGIYRGRSPINVTGLSAGIHEVNVTYPGYTSNISTIILSDVRESVGVMRIGDDGQGDLLPAEFLYHDPAANMDYFTVSSPEGLSRFSLVTLDTSGNMFQILYLSLQEWASPKSGGGGGGGGYSGGGGAVASEPNPVVNPTPVQDIPVAPKETIAQASGADMPSAAARISGPAVADTPASAGQAEADQAGDSPVVSTMPFTMSLLKNLSIVFLVFFITIVLYVRWKRSGGGEGNE